MSNSHNGIVIPSLSLKHLRQDEPQLTHMVNENFRRVGEAITALQSEETTVTHGSINIYRWKLTAATFAKADTTSDPYLLVPNCYPDQVMICLNHYLRVMEEFSPVVSSYVIQVTYGGFGHYDKSVNINPNTTNPQWDMNDGYDCPQLPSELYNNVDAANDALEQNKIWAQAICDGGQNLDDVTSGWAWLFATFITLNLTE